MSGQVVGVWEVVLGGKKHTVEFEHGTTSGRRVVRIGGKEVVRRDWLFKLVGHESFDIGSTPCSVVIRPGKGLAFEYALLVAGKQYDKFREQQSRILCTWVLDVRGTPTRVVLEKDSLDVWVNGEKMETAGEFVEDGTETHFALGPLSACIRTVSSGDRRQGIVHSLVVEGALVPTEAPQ